MAKTIIAQYNQSMRDVVLMACGTLQGAMAFCRANGVSISELPVVGQEYIIPDGIATDKAVLRELAEKGVVIGTLNRIACPLVTGMALYGEPGPTSFQVSFVIGEGVVSVEYTHTAVDAEPSEFESYLTATESPITVGGIASETTRRVWLRSVCEDSVSPWVYVDGTTAEAPPEPPSLAATIILKPAMKGLVGTSPYQFVMARNTLQFIHTYDLLADWLNLTPIQMENMSDYEGDLGAGATWFNRIVGGMGSVANYGPVDGPIPGNVRMAFIRDLTGAEIGLPEAEMTFTVKDVNGNMARETPLVLIPDSWNNLLVRSLVPDINIETVSATETEVVVRVTRSHAATGEAYISVDSMEWHSPGAPLGIDPDNPLNEDIKLLTLTAGTYVVGVKTIYTGTSITDWPNSRREIVIEVALP